MDRPDSSLIPERSPLPLAANRHSATFPVMAQHGKTVLVLGGGGVKGVAHAGAWRALVQHGVKIDEIVGTSIGALVGATIAGGASPDVLAENARSLTKADIVDINRWALLPMGIRQESLFRGEALRHYIERVLPVTEWSELSIPLTVNAVDLETGDTVWFGAGGRTDVPLGDAIYSSAALPVFYPPARIHGMHLVDGGVMDTVPITMAADRGAARIIAVQTSSGKEKDAADTIDKGLVAIHHRITDIMAHARRDVVEDSWFGPPILKVEPDVSGYSTFDFDAVDFFLEEGFRAMSAALEG